MTARPHTRLAAAALGLAALFLAGCSAPAETPAPAPTATETEAVEADFPRTVEVPAGPTTEAATVEIPAEPQRIAALTYETAELVAALGAADRLVMVPEAVTNPVLTNHQAEMAAVETRAATESTTNAEAVIQTAPDLVLLSARHGLEEGAGRVLADAGIPVLILPNHWASMDDMGLNITLVGEAIGADAAAEDLVDGLAAGLDPVAAADGAPRVLVLSNQAGRPFVTAGAAFPLELLRLAGATDASADLGLKMTGPITAEQVIQAAPDAILMIDMNGSGERLFAPIMENPAVTALPAIAEGRVLLLEGRHTQALGFQGLVEGYDALTEWLGTAK